MTDISTEVTAREQTMNALIEYYEPDGRKLENGMVVLLADPNYKYGTLSANVAALRVANRWCRVSEFKHYGNSVKFTGTYGDGETAVRFYPSRVEWYVKRDSVQKPDVKRDAVDKLVKQALIDDWTYDPEEIRKKTVDAIMKVFEGE